MDSEELIKNLKSECGFLNWHDLENHFARGVVRIVSVKSNLIDIAVDIAQNNSKNISDALSKNIVSEPSDSQARQWHEKNSTFKCVVVAPFVLIQACNSESGSN